MTYKTTLTHVERLRDARKTRAINVSEFIRAAVERALDELEGKPAQFAGRRVAVRAYAAGGAGGF